MIDAPPFHFWIRRSAGDGAVFSVRFEVEEGKGLLRVARPGVLVDPPAQETGFEEKLTPAQVRASRFLHVWQQGRKRQGYVLSRLSDDALGQLPLDNWENMRVVSEGGFYWLVPGPPPQTEGRLVDIIDPNDSLDSISMESLQPLLGRGRVFNNEPPQRQADLMPDSDELDTEATLLDPSQIESLDDEQTAPSEPAELHQDLMAFGRSTALVRHLRREKHRDRQRIGVLQAEVERLEAALAEAARRETDLRTRVARYQRRLKARESAFPK